MKNLLASLMLCLCGTVAGASHERSEYELLKRFPEGRLAALTAGAKPDERGFIGGNHTQGEWTEVAMQRGGCWYLISAVVDGDAARAEDAWRSIDAAFAHQLPEGSFASIPTKDTGPKDPYAAKVQTAFFYLQELGHAILVIRQSPMEPQFHERIAALEPKIRKSCEFISAGYDSIIKESGKSVNRIFIAAKAFGLCSRVLGDEQLLATARKLVAFGLQQRDDGGVFLEKGGRDSSYNAVSIFFGSVLALHMPIPDFEAALPAAMTWQRTQIKATGEVDVSSNTRTGVGKETFLGKPKGVNYTEVIFAFTYYGLMRSDAEALALADKIYAWSRAPHS